MNSATEQQQRSNIDPIKEFMNAALQAMTSEMVTDLVIKMVKAVELADQVLQPETLSLLQKLPEVSSSLERTLHDVKRLEEKGTLTTLFQMAELIGNMKSAMTGAMITESVEKLIQGVEIADRFMQQGALELAGGFISAFEKAQDERRSAEQPLTLMQMIRTLKDPHVREGMSLFLSFVKALPGELSKGK
jgi:uncharacterized protein YjgD (DUF1641 family)